MLCKQTLARAEKANEVATDQYGSRKHHKAITACLNKSYYATHYGNTDEVQRSCSQIAVGIMTEYAILWLSLLCLVMGSLCLFANPYSQPSKKQDITSKQVLVAHTKGLTEMKSSQFKVLGKEME